MFKRIISIQGERPAQPCFTEPPKTQLRSHPCDALAPDSTVEMFIEDEEELA
jgi:hypothetical protein